MKRALLILPVVIVGVLFVLLLRAQTGSNSLTLNESELPPLESSPDQAPPVEDPPTSSIQSALVQPVPPEDARPATIFRLADGDSFDIVWADNGDIDEVRLSGINAPESGACFGTEARETLRSLAEDRELLIETLERDEFGRVLGNVWVDGLFLNASMVELGAALTLSGDGRHAKVIEQAAELARDEGVGLWDECGAQASSLRIGWIEANAPGQDNLNKNGEWIEIVNDGEDSAELTGWSIRDESTRHRFFFPDGFQLDAAASVRVFSGCGDDTADELYWCDDDPVWNNGGDTGFLVDADGKFVDTRSYSG